MIKIILFILEFAFVVPLCLFLTLMSMIFADKVYIHIAGHILNYITDDREEKNKFRERILLEKIP